MFRTNLILIFSLITLVNCKTAPVLLWGTNSDLRPALEVLSINDLQEIISEKTETSMVLVFAEQQLRNSDFSLCKLNDKEDCFKYLSSLESKTYYARVEDPVNALRELDVKKEYVNVIENGELDHTISYGKGKVVFVNFDGISNLNRAKILSQHDEIIKSIYEKVSSKGSVTALYTSLEPQTIVRKTRQATTEPSDKGKILKVENKFLIYYTELYFKENGKQDITNVTLTAASSGTNSSKDGFDVVLSGNYEIRFTVKHTPDGYWSIENFKMANEDFRVDPAISVPDEFSYYCGIGAEFVGKTKMLTWKGLQLEAFFKNQKQDESLKFDDAWHCVGFTTAGIWSGLFVTFMMLAILSVGITWLMDINTMDRFDDPKGKTITINAGE